MQGCRVVEGDLRDRSILEKIFSEEQIEAVIHFAATIEVEESVINPAKYFDNNVLGTLNLLNAMVEFGVSRLVFSSTAAVYGNPLILPIKEESQCLPINPYGESKLMAEKMTHWFAQAYGLRAVGLRYFNAAGAWPEEQLGYFQNARGPHLIPRVLNVALGNTPELEVYGQDYDTPDQTCVRDYVHVLDLAHAHALALESLHHNQGLAIYNVGTGRGYSVMQVVDEAMVVTGKMIPIVSKPRRAGDPAHLVADNRAFRQATNWQPALGLSAILESSWEWQKQHEIQEM